PLLLCRATPGRLHVFQEYGSYAKRRGSARQSARQVLSSFLIFSRTWPQLSMITALLKVVTLAKSDHYFICHSQPSPPCRASNADVRLPLLRLPVGASERTCVVGEWLSWVYVSGWWPEAAQRVETTITKARKRRLFRTTTPPSVSTKKPSNPIP